MRKRIIMICLATVMTSSLLGCSSNNTAGSSTNSNITSEIAEVDETIEGDENSGKDSEKVSETIKEPTKTPEPTKEQISPTLKPTEMPSVTEKVEPTKTPEPTATPESTEVPLVTEKIEPTKAPKPEFTYIDLDLEMYAQAALNVRTLPSTDGELLGNFTLGEKVKVTGQCNETKWYRVEVKDKVGYCSNNFLDTKEPVIATPTPVPTKVPVQTPTEEQTQTPVENNKPENNNTQTTDDLPTEFDEVYKGLQAAMEGGYDYTWNDSNFTNEQKENLVRLLAQDMANYFLSVGTDKMEAVQLAAEYIGYVCSISEYTNEDPDYRTAYGLLMKNVYTCAGATRAMGMVLDCMGIKWIHVNENQNTHQWCEIPDLDGQKAWADGMAGYAGYGEYGDGPDGMMFIPILNPDSIDYSVLDE